MIQSMREMAHSWIFKALMILLVASFGIWGIGDMFRGNPLQREVAEVGDISVPVQSLEQRFQSALPEARRIYGPQLTAQEARKMGVLERTLNIMLEELSFAQETQRLDINVPDDIVLKRIMAEPSLHDDDGKFSKARWEQWLRRMGRTERSFVDQQREETARNLIFMSILPNVKAPKIMVDTLYQARGAKRILDVVALDHKSLNGIKQPDEKTLKAFYEETKDQYIAPEYRGITVAKLSVESLKDDVTVTDKELKEAYDARAKELTEPEKRDFVQLVLQDEAKAKKLSENARELGSLKKAAKAISMTPIRMKKLDKRLVLPALRDSLFALKSGETSQAVKSPLGWHVMEIQKIYPGGLPPFEKVQKKLRKQIQEERVGDNLARLVNQWDDDLAAGQPLEEIADTLQLRLQRIAAVDQKGMTPEGKLAKEIPVKDMLLESAFDLDSGETGPVLEDGRGNYFVVRVDNVTLSQARPYNNVKPKIENSWYRLKQLEIADKKIKEMAQAMRAGKAAKKFAAEKGVSVRVSKPISFLGDMDEQVPVTVMKQVFEMKKGDVITATHDQKSFVLRLADIVQVNPDKPEKSRLKVEESLRQELPKNYIEEYALYLHELFPRQIDANLLDQLKKSGSE